MCWKWCKLTVYRTFDYVSSSRLCGCDQILPYLDCGLNFHIMFMISFPLFEETFQKLLSYR